MKVTLELFESCNLIVCLPRDGNDGHRRNSIEKLGFAGAFISMIDSMILQVL